MWLSGVVGGVWGEGGPAVGARHSAWHRSPDAAALGPEWVPGQQCVEQETKKTQILQKNHNVLYAYVSVEP